MASLLKSSPYELYSHQDILQKTYHRPLKLYHLQSIYKKNTYLNLLLLDLSSMNKKQYNNSYSFSKYITSFTHRDYTD